MCSFNIWAEGLDLKRITYSIVEISVLIVTPGDILVTRFGCSENLKSNLYRRPIWAWHMLYLNLKDESVKDMKLFSFLNDFLKRNAKRYLNK